MNDKKEKLDLLLNKNTTEQLAKVNFAQLHTAISKRLDKIDQGRTTTRKGPVVFKFAAGIAAAAAVILIILMVDTQKPSALKTEQGCLAIVKFIETKGSAKVVFTIAKPTQTFVSISQARPKTATCDIKIIDIDGQFRKSGDRPTWIMITKPKPVLATNGFYTDMINTMCMF